jgi:hypothetical protein
MNIQTFLANILIFLNGTLVPFLLAVASLIFIWNAVHYFILEGENEESQTKAKSLAFWGIGAFVVIVSLWGIVNMVVNGLGFARPVSITPDYMDSKHIAPDDWGAGSNLSTGSDADCVRTDTCFDP